MSHAFVTVIAAVPVEKSAEVRAMIHALGNPAEARIAETLDGMSAIHFASLNLFEASAGDRAHLVLELSGDGDADELLRKLDSALAAQLGPVFAHARDRGSDPLSRFWNDHAVEVGQGLFSNPGVHFAGTPAMSVDRIRREAGLAGHVAMMVDAQPPAGTALDRLGSVRAALGADPDWKWALEPEPLPDGGTGGDLPGTVLASLPIVLPLALPFAGTFLWPFAILALAVFAISWGMRDFALHGILPAVVPALGAALGVALVTAGLLYGLLRRREAAEVPVDRPPERRSVDAIMARENFASQNHLAALSVMKPGILRRVTLRLAFWFMVQLSARYFRPGFLGTLGTIHFARWVTVPGTRDLLFLSNYGGSWESYLEDFITKAHTGLTGIWSNTVGFPRTSNLFQDGATDGERFKRWARRQQIPTGFWYSAYPGLTTANIRANAVVRQGLGAAMTEDEARRWLSLFGSQQRPAATLEAGEIQSIVFGGLGFLREAAALLFSLGDDVRAARAWLRDTLPNIAFADGRSLGQATILGLAASGLRRLGLPEESVATFPCAFVDGMAAPWRSRALGDVGPNAPCHWWWGGSDTDGPDQRVDGILILYCRTAEDLDRFRLDVAQGLSRHGHVLRRALQLRPLPRPEVAALDKSEPFGFLDGISQPIIRGTYKALRGADPIHVVEPGEFVLGYPDNRGNLPPTPTIAAMRDPFNLLPVAADPAPGFSRNIVNADRDLGRNGTFLVVRQLEQEVESFWAYCRREGERLEHRFPPGVQARPEEFIAAKIVGRWRDGSPLVRYPRWPASESPRPSHPLIRTTGGPAESRVPQPIASAAMRGPSFSRGAKDAALATDAGDQRLRIRPPFEPDNDFLFGAEDPQGLRCPYGAHVRRANPRESFDPGSRNQLDITNRHRLLRVGRPYLPEGEQKPGLFFMCLNGDLERQFEFVQQTWAEGASFHGLANERDPLIGSRLGTDSHSVPTGDGPMTLRGLPTFVRPRGGGYFLVPGRRTLAFLAGDPIAASDDLTA